jgi:uncharacterized protein YoxC
MKKFLLPLILLISLVVFAEPATQTGITIDTTTSELVIRLDSLEEQVHSLQSENETLKIELSEVQGDVSEKRSLDASVVESLNSIPDQLKGISSKIDNQSDFWITGANVVLAVIALISFIGTVANNNKEKKHRESLFTPEIQIDFADGFSHTPGELSQPTEIVIKNNNEYDIMIKSFTLTIFSLSQKIEINSLNPKQEDSKDIDKIIVTKMRKKIPLISSKSIEKYNEKANIEITLEIKTKYFPQKTMLFEYDCVYEPDYLEIFLKNKK